jgi:hypothetical protein
MLGERPVLHKFIEGGRGIGLIKKTDDDEVDR